MPDPDNLYEVLGVPKTATAAEIESAYRRLARKTHPDVGGTSPLFRSVQEAYETLSDPARRAEYDRSGRAASRSKPPEPPQRAAQSDLERLVSRRPWIVPVAIGVFLFLVSGVINALSGIAFLSLLTGLVAAAGSRRAWARLALRSVPAAQVDSMDGTAFEHFCAEVLRANGYHVQHVGKSGDYGADLIISSHAGHAVVQAKRYSGNVGLDAVQQVSAARAHYRTSQAIVLTNSYFTDAAWTLARSNAVELWDRNVLFTMATRASALPAPSAPALLLMQIGSGLVVIGRVVMSLLAASASLGAASSARPRPASKRRRRRW
ncbi:MAG: restriction endonuclease [Actinobacteria bacterium]|nr:restriction endonuclease [Actinomycetota bacterium]